MKKPEYDNKFKAHRVLIGIDIFESVFTLFFANDINNAAKLADDWFNMADGEKSFQECVQGALGYACSIDRADGATAFLVILPKLTDNKTVYHEALHLSWYVLDTFGVKIDLDNHEIQAYLQGHIAEQIKKYINTKY